MSGIWRCFIVGGLLMFERERERERWVKSKKCVHRRWMMA